MPYLLLTLRPMRIYLTRAKATGYDMMGILCPKLSAAQVAQKQQIERELQLRKLELDHRSGIAKLADRTAVRASAGLDRAATRIKWAVHTSGDRVKRCGSSIAGSVRGAGSVLLRKRLRRQCSETRML